MFDIGFWEIAMIAIIALLVVGPERLPALARTAGKWVGKARGFVSNVKQDIDLELKAEELQRILTQQAKSSPLEDIQELVEEVKKPLSSPQNPDKPDHE